MSVKKQFLNSKPECKVTFRLSKNECENAENVALLGSFTNWKANAVRMNKLKSGEFTAVVTLPSNASYEYRYLINGSKWINDPQADGYRENGLGSKNSVVTTAN